MIESSTNQKPGGQNAGGMIALAWPSALNIGLLSLLLGVIFFLYHFFGVTDVGYDFRDTTHSAFRWIYERWLGDWRGTWFAHSHLVPLISLWLVWRDRTHLARMPCRTFYPGILVIVLAMVLHWAGVKSQQTRLTIISMVVLSWGLPLFICGWPVARRLIFPCGFLVFSLPLNFFDAAAYPIRIISAALSAGLLAGLGVDVSRVGAVIFSNSLSGFSVDLADSRSSIFAVTGSVAYSMLSAYLARTTWIMRCALVAASIPLLITANILRGIVIVLTAELLGSGAGESAYRALSGPIILVVCFGGITALAWYVHQHFPLAKPVETAAPSNHRASVRRALLTSLILVAAAAWWIPTNLYITHVDEAGVTLELPSHNGDWRGGMVLFCHNRQDPGDVMDGNLHPGDPCPRCGQPLHEMSWIEKSLLPPDTIIRKNRYENNTERRVYLSIVLSGRYRSSIHRPEVCLVGPNSQIADSFVHDVPLADGRVLKVTILEMLVHFTTPDGNTVATTSYYAYWFAGIGRETHSHYTRMLWMAQDRLFRNLSYRWAYISMAGRRIEGQRDYLAEIDSFLKTAYPFLIK